LEPLLLKRLIEDLKVLQEKLVGLDVDYQNGEVSLADLGNQIQ